MTLLNLPVKNELVLPSDDIAIAISQPWITFILWGAKVTPRGEKIFGVPSGTKIFKTIENRSWHLPEKYCDRPVWLYSPNRVSSFGEEWAQKFGIECPDRKSLQTGKVLGFATFSEPDKGLGAFAFSDPWAFDGEFNWKIDSAAPVKPFLIETGKLRFFKFERLA